MVIFFLIGQNYIVWNDKLFAKHATASLFSYMTMRVKTLLQQGALRIHDN